VRLNGVIKDMMRTMSSAAMWSVAYGAIDTLKNSFVGAIRYAKDLNKALTDISIVSDLSAS
jgi:hypothetical protein